MAETPEIPVEPAPDPRRVAYFRAFLRAGGSVSLEIWLRLAASDMAALIDAGAQVQAERAGLLAASLALHLAPPPTPAPTTDEAMERAGRRANAHGGA